MGFLETFKQEWGVISGAPWSFMLAVLAAAGIIWALVWLITRGEKNALKEQNNALREQNGTLKTQKELAEQISREEKERSARLAKELTALQQKPVPPAFNQVANSSTQVIASLFEIEEKKTIRFTGRPEDWSPDQLAKFAQFSVLQDAQAVSIHVQQIAPMESVVTSTNTATLITGYIKNLKNPYK